MKQTRMARAAAKRRRIAHARKHAPRHPPGPEARIRREVSKAFSRYHVTLIDAVIAYAKGKKAQREQARAGDDAPDPLLHSVLYGLFMHGRQFLAQSPFQRILTEQAQKTGDSAKKQVAKALELEDFNPDLSPIQKSFVDDVYDSTVDHMEDSVDRAIDNYEEWDELDPETSPRAGNIGALHSILDAGLDGIAGAGLASAGLAFGDLFGKLNKGAQSAAGVSKYAWIAQKDSATRPEHRDLDGEECDWDDPPLSAEDSSSGEECHPGEDFNCRCTASPIPPEDEDEEV